MAYYRDTTKYGGTYWGILVPEHVSKSQEIFLMADRIRITPHGDLVAMGSWKDEEGEASKFVNLSLSAGNWIAFYAASMLDGHAVAVDHWDGMIANDVDDVWRQNKAALAQEKEAEAE